jgi:hypothetical protein
MIDNASHQTPQAEARATKSKIAAGTAALRKAQAPRRFRRNQEHCATLGLLVPRSVFAFGSI